MSAKQIHEEEIVTNPSEQAARLEQLMPKILRRLFTLGHAGVLADMPLGQLRICSYLQDAPRSMSSISEELGMSTSAVTQIADRMERAGLVERVSAVEDRRLKHLHLTPLAREMMEARRATRTSRAAEALALLPESVRAELLSGLEQLFEATQRIASPVEIDPWDRVDTTVTTL